MELKDLVPDRVREAWAVANGTADPVTATPHGAYNTPDSFDRAHADVTTSRYPNGNLAGVSGGLGAWDGPIASKDTKRQFRMLDAHADLGRFKDRDGADAMGFNADAGFLEFKGENLELGTASASARAMVSNKGAELGLQADGPQIALGGGESGTASDEHIRGGFSPIGPGLSARLHWDDEDGDGLRELGFGADIGDFSFDFTTEDPLRSVARALSFNSIGGRVGAPEGDAERNWTAEAVGYATDLFGHFAD